MFQGDPNLCAIHVALNAYDFVSWDKDTYGRKIVDSLEDSSKKKDRYEEFIFVVRRQYGVSRYGTYLLIALTSK